MKVFRRPVYTFATPSNGRVTLSIPQAGDQVAVSTAAEVRSLPAPIIGWATTSSGMSLYTPGTTSAAFRSAVEEDDSEEYFFTSTVPTKLSELIVGEYQVGQLVYYRVAEQAKNLSALRKAA